MNNHKLAAASRIIFALLTVLNSALAHWGHSPIPVSEEFIYQLLSDFVVVGALGWIGYKNNDFTPEAAKGTAVTHKLKNKKLSRKEQGALHKVKDIK